jgi:hypothetical protein
MVASVEAAYGGDNHNEIRGSSEMGFGLNGRSTTAAFASIVEGFVGLSSTTTVNKK